MSLTLEHIDALKELINIGVGRAMGALNQMLEAPVRLYVPTVKIGKISELQHELGGFGDERLSLIQLPFKASFEGVAALMFPTESAAKLVSICTRKGADASTLNAMKIATLTEIGNIVLNGVMGSMSQILEQRMTYSVPKYDENSIRCFLNGSQWDPSLLLLWAETHFTIEEFAVTGHIFLLLGLGSLETLGEALGALFPSVVEQP